MAPEALVQATLNGVPLGLPAGTLVTMSHGIHRDQTAGLVVLVETAHLNWMMERLRPGGTFIDVGAATGATAIPVASKFGGAVRIIAYEPARRARRLLIQTLDANRIADIDVRPFAVSDREGLATFREYLPDRSGNTPWTPETSRLVTDGQSRLLADEDFVVTMVTLDVDALPACLDGPVVVKIDVEGFEAAVLGGARRLLLERKPFFSIDIHHDPFLNDGTMTKPAVEAILAPLGYGFTTLDHVLLCEPQT